MALFNLVDDLLIIVDEIIKTDAKAVTFLVFSKLDNGSLYKFNYRDLSFTSSVDSGNQGGLNFFFSVTGHPLKISTEMLLMDGKDPEILQDLFVLLGDKTTTAISVRKIAEELRKNQEKE